MSNEEPTIPPVREPNTPRKFLRIAWAWIEAHPDRVLIFALGALAGAVLF